MVPPLTMEGVFAPTYFPQYEGDQMSRQHQAVLEEDKVQLELCLEYMAHRHKDDMIVGQLKGGPKTAKQLLASMKPFFPNIDKSEINSRLYTMLVKKGVVKNAAKVPVWSFSR